MSSSWGLTRRPFLLKNFKLIIRIKEQNEKGAVRPSYLMLNMIEDFNIFIR